MSYQKALALASSASSSCSCSCSFASSSSHFFSSFSSTSFSACGFSGNGLVFHHLLLLSCVEQDRRTQRVRYPYPCGREDNASRLGRERVKRWVRLNNFELHHLRNYTQSLPVVALISLRNAMGASAILELPRG